MRFRSSLSVVVLVLMSVGCTFDSDFTDSDPADFAPSDGEDGAAPSNEGFEVVDERQNVKRGERVGETDMLAIVRILGGASRSRFACTGTVIASDTVLTSAHCTCTEDDCRDTVTVLIRAGANGRRQTQRVGTVIRHPNFEPQRTHVNEALMREVKRPVDDVAVIKLDEDVPDDVKPMRVRKSSMPSTTVAMVGGPMAGEYCTERGSYPTKSVVKIQGKEDGYKVLRFDEFYCEEDIGGPVLWGPDLVVGIASGNKTKFGPFWGGRAVNVYKYHDWIREQTCGTSLWSYCSGKGPICQCANGFGDCDSNADCKNVCVQNNGADFGYASNVDVCVPNIGPGEGTCSCENNFGPVCTPTETRNNCSAGFVPSCTPTRNDQGTACGGCECI